MNGEKAGVSDLSIFARNGDGIAVQAGTPAQLLVMDEESFDEPSPATARL